MVPFNFAVRQKVAGSALSPLLWLFGTCSAFCAALYAANAVVAGYIALGLTCIVLAVTLYVYIYLLNRDPNRLHSEHHIQQMKAIDTLGDSQAGKVIEGIPVSNPFNGVSDDNK